MPKQYKGYKYRIYPNKAQQEQIKNNIGCARFVYNRALELRSSAWKNEKKTVTYADTVHMIDSLRRDPEYLWLLQAHYPCLLESCKDLDRAFQRFFKGTAKYPKHHKKHRYRQSFRIPNQSYSIYFKDERHIILPSIGTVRIKKSRAFTERILNAAVSMTPTGKYFVSLCVAQELPDLGNRHGTIGIDVGLDSFFTDSNGVRIENPKYFRKYERRLKREQRRLSRMIRANISGYTENHAPVYIRPLYECRNIQKQRMKIARIHEKIADCRADFLHKLSRTLVSENQVICVEDLNVKGMLKEHRLAKSISDASWSEFIRQLEYKALEHGTRIVKVPQYYASSQRCSACGTVNPAVKDLSIRSWTCPVCQAEHDRDHNAAQNILQKGLLQIDM